MARDLTPPSASDAARVVRLIAASKHPPLRRTRFGIGDLVFLYTTGFIAALNEFHSALCAAWNGRTGGGDDRAIPHCGGSCDLTAVSSLPGNWTHGDYVIAVAANGASVQIQEAAQSDCGKPMVSVGHGGGPPEHALEHMAAGKAHVGGNAEEEGSETSGS